MNHTCTYSPDDNKLRLYPACRLDKDDYAQVKAAGYRWAPQQALFFATWTPEAEDLALDFCDEIGDEDQSLTERAEVRAERFESYSDNRASEAQQAQDAVSAIADGIPFGQPILVGHHSERHARKDAEKIQNGMRRAVRLWETSAYWTDRAKGAIRHAKYLERPDVRARRIKTIEADMRRRLREKDLATRQIAQWNDPAKDLTWDRARMLANSGDCYYSRCYPVAEFPRLTPDASLYEGAMGLWSALDGIITPELAREFLTRSAERIIAHADRWIEHYSHRLEYEHGMLDEQGGTVADQKGPQVGGACRCWASARGGWSYIVKVNKVSITLYDNWGNGGKNFTRTIRFDELKAIMTKAEVEKKRAEGLLVELADKTGFILADQPVKPVATPPEPENGVLAKMKATLKAGVQVVTANQLFPTPHDVAQRMWEIAEVEPEHWILEPSAGTGAILNAGGNFNVTAIEINPTLADRLRETQPDKCVVICCDFMECGQIQRNYDRILMNPPFEHGSDVKHILHALTFLKPGGRLVAICANGPLQNERLKPLADTWEALPEGTFAGTGVRTVLLTINKPPAAPEASKPLLAETADEAQRMTYAGRSWPALKEAKTFDSERINSLPLFERRLFQ